MSLHELSNPYCIAGIIIFIIIIIMNIYYKFFTENFAIEPVTPKINNDLINNIKNQLATIQSNLDKVNNTNYNKLNLLLSSKNINIIEAYPYLPLYSILMQNSDLLDKNYFNETFELSTEDLALINNNKEIVDEILTDYIYILVLYKNYVPDEYVNSSLNSEFILNKKYKLIYNSEYVQFIKSVNTLKENNNKLYELLIKYIFGFNQIIGDYYYGMKINIIFDTINSYINTIETKNTTQKDELADIYINLNYIIEYLPSFKTYVDSIINEKNSMIEIFNKENINTTSGVPEETTSGVPEETTSGVPEETTSGVPEENPQ